MIFGIMASLIHIKDRRQERRQEARKVAAERASAEGNDEHAAAEADATFEADEVEKL